MNYRHPVPRKTFVIADVTAGALRVPSNGHLRDDNTLLGATHPGGTHYFRSSASRITGPSWRTASVLRPRDRKWNYARHRAGDAAAMSPWIKNGFRVHGAHALACNLFTRLIWTSLMTVYCTLNFHYRVNRFKKERRNLWANLLIVTTCFGNSELTLSAQRFSFLVFFLFYFGSCGRLSWLNCQLSSVR